MFAKMLYILLLLLVWLCMFQLAVSVSPSNFTDQATLLAFKSKLDFDPTNTVLAGNWSTKTNFCGWIGVSCSRRRQRVTALNLSCMGVQGTISPHIGNLSFLVSLDLSNNSFSGSLPHEITHLHRLRFLYLAFNQLAGNIPPSLHQCRKLQVIDLWGNKLSGGIPNELGILPKLRKLLLGQNNLMGAIPPSISNISTLERLNSHENGHTGSFPSAIYNMSSLIIISIAKNRISGSLPIDLCHHWSDIQYINFGYNKFYGRLPSIYQCRELSMLSFNGNNFDGSIPEGIGSSPKMEELYLGVNRLTGTIPPTIANMSSLRILSLPFNNIEGRIPIDFGSPWLHNLETLALANNQLGGNIPPNLSNFSKLVILDIALNLFSGPIPTSLGNLKRLRYLGLSDNKLTGEPGNPELTFFSALSNCKSLETLNLENNPLNGFIPKSIGNLSHSLRLLYAPGCQIKGNIPKGIGSLKNLTFLELSGNNLTGSIPSEIGGLERLQKLYLYDNMIEGVIPEELCHLKNLGILYLQDNKISGSIPSCIGNLSLLQKLYLDSNKLTSSIPMSLWSLENLLFLDLSFNSLGGLFHPNMMRKLDVIEFVDLSNNQITGSIPSIIGAFESLSYLSLNMNSFQGVIPNSFGDLKGLEFLDISYNNLSGAIPKSLEALPYLTNLNLSFNKLSGEIPFGGHFSNFTAKSFLENKALCGLPTFGVPPCTSPSSQESRVRQVFLKYVLPAISSIIIFVALVYMLRKHRKRNVPIPSSTDQTLAVVELRIISYQELCQATNYFCESNLLGIGSFGAVYKGILSDGTNVAVKILNLQLEAAFKSFDIECKVLRTIRHRNLVKVISSCSNPELRALVLQYMSNGSLEKWLYSHNYCLNLLQRVSIMVDVAVAVEYLHHGQSEPVVHCDLKPNNILLDEDMVAHVADFGIAKILVENKEATQTKTLGTLGYIAPEYGLEGKVSVKGDVYSYGIMLLEMITRKKPIDEMFSGELTLRQWINASLFPDKIMEVVDIGLLRIEDGREVIALQSIILSIMELGLKCSEELPEERIHIKDVVTKLDKIKLSLQRS